MFITSESNKMKSNDSAFSTIAATAWSPIRRTVLLIEMNRHSNLEVFAHNETLVQSYSVCLTKENIYLYIYMLIRRVSCTRRSCRMSWILCVIFMIPALNRSWRSRTRKYVSIVEFENLKPPQSRDYIQKRGCLLSQIFAPIQLETKSDF